MEPPKLSTEQRRAALRKAAEARRTRANFKARLSAGTLEPSAGLEEALADDILARIRITAFLNSLPGWGRARTDDFVRDNGLAANRSLRGLGRVQLATVRAVLATRDTGTV